MILLLPCFSALNFSLRLIFENMAALSTRGMNGNVADKVVLKDVILSGGCLDQIQQTAFIRVLNVSVLKDSLYRLKMRKTRSTLSR